MERVKKSRPQYLIAQKVVKMDRFDGFRYTLDDGSWLLIRFSGTEPLLRIYAESDNLEKGQHLLDRGQEIAGLAQVTTR